MCARTTLAASGVVCLGKPHGVTVEVGGIPISLRSDNAGFCHMIEQRYSGFLNPLAPHAYEFEVCLQPPSRNVPDEDARVSSNGERWRFERGDFRAEWDTVTRRGWVRQSANPYSIDSVLRIAHSLVLAEEGGFLVHAASAVRDGHAFLFAGVSGTGKTTISRSAPADATILTDEISYVRRRESHYRAWGTPFADELDHVGANVSAPLDALFFLVQGPVNRVEPVGQLAAAHELMRHILFFAHDPDAVKRVFYAALEFVSCMKVARLVCTPDERAWELVGCRPRI
jgi:hypothetical protein